jgi:thiol-disulfide isomerase/thioredoxin
MYKLLTALLIMTINLSAQTYNEIVIDEKSEKPMLIGYTNRYAFNDTTFSWWFNSAYEDYEFDSGAVAQISNLINDLKILVVMGTWCSDSRREVPHFYKILDEIKFPVEKLTIINVNRKKEADVKELNGLNIELVPTFIFYKYDKEIGRIIETPEESLESDFLKILSK